MGNTTCKSERRDRLVTDSTGDLNISHHGIEGKLKHYLLDFFTTMIEMSWAWSLGILVGLIFITWVLFAGFYYLMGYIHGDYLEAADSDGWQPCVENVKTFTGSYLFSIETQTTIGYGSRYVTEQCPPVYMAVFLQSVIGAGLQVVLAGLVIAKVRKPKFRLVTVLFSKMMCIEKFDEVMKLSFRIGDLRKSQMFETKVRGILVKTVKGKSGHTVPTHYYHVPFTSEDGHESIPLAWPVQAVHSIDENSPFWCISKDSLLKEEFELIIIFEGVVSSTGAPVQIKTSYTQKDIIWGHRFVMLGGRSDENGRCVINYDNFNVTYPVSVPTCSAEGLKLRSEDSKTQQDKAVDKTGEYIVDKDGKPRPVQLVPSRSFCVMDTYLGHGDIEEMGNSY